MPAVHVCPLSQLSATVTACDASHVATLINAGTAVPLPPAFPRERHVFIGVNDITMPADGMIHPTDEHVRTFLDFVDAWDERRPLVIHCWAGISRSTAAAFIAVAARRPGRDERAIAAELRRRSPSATPNRLIITLADAALGRGGRMVAAIEAIGRGSDAFEGTPFALPLDER